MIFEICATVITVLLVILTVYLIQTLKTVQDSLKSSKVVLENLADEVTSLKADLHLLLSESTAAAEKINVRINDFDPLLEALASVGRTLKGTAQAFEARQNAEEWAERNRASRWQEGIGDVLELTNIGMKIFQQFQRRK